MDQRKPGDSNTTALRQPPGSSRVQRLTGVSFHPGAQRMTAALSNQSTASQVSAVLVPLSGLVAHAACPK
jgi:hypothetical protein